MPPTIMIVDDDDQILTLVEILLRRQGYHVLKAQSPYIALELLDSASPDLALLDYMMPGMEPIACVGALRKLAERDVEIVLVTAAVDAAKRAAELGIVRYLSKPFGVEQLRGVVAHSLARPDGTPQR